MRRYLPRLMLTGALLTPATLYALGLGEIRLGSALNQPFDAEIELIAPTSEELATLKIGLANNDLFARYGLDRPAFLSDFDFSITRGRDGRAAIKVTSNRAVTEPFVTLLVEANWGRGRLLREYTVLLDPPVFMPSQPEAQTPIAAPQSGAPTAGRIEREQELESTRTVPAPQATPAAEPVVRDVPSPATAPSAGEALTGSYTVERNDTLWRIASRVQPGASPRVVNQTMIALFRANPEAFDGNINMLRAGRVLRIPEQAEIDAISAAEAAQEVSRQQQEWSGAARFAAGEETSRLRLVPPEEAPSVPAPSSSAEAPSAATTAGEPATAPSADDRRLEVTSPELAAAQQQVSEAPLTAEPQAEIDPTAQPQVDETEVGAQAEATPPPAARPQPQRTPAAATQPDEPSFLDRLISFWWVPVLLGLLVIGALAFLKRRREQTDVAQLADLPDADDSFEFTPSAASATASRGDALPLEEPAVEEHDTGEFEAPVTAQREDTSDALEFDQPEVAAAPASEDTLSSETSVRLDEQDALAEADFHMAYGLYDQAADLVKIAIDREPERRDLKLKLLEIYFVWGNKDLFLDTARELHGTRDQAAAGEWDKVLIMGKQIAPDDALFKGEGSGPVDLVDVNLEGGENRVDVDLFAEPGQDDPSASLEKSGLDLQFTTGEHEPQGESDLDFLLDDEPAREEEPTREMDQLARTQETPTIESPLLDRSETTLREPMDTSAFAKPATDQTAELSLDDLDLDVDSLEATGSLEDTAALREDTDETRLAQPLADDELTQLARSIGDDDRTQLAPSLGSLDRTMQAPSSESFDIESTGTIFIDQVDLSGGGDTVEQRRPDVESTAALQRPTDIDVDLDLDELEEPVAASDDTLRQSADADTDAARFSDDVFSSDRTASFPKIDLDVGEPLSAEDREPTNKVITTEMELSELEPVTMSEVGTKLDLARAYMDMGDPDGARSILDEVVQEGNSGQKQEAMRLLESIR